MRWRRLVAAHCDQDHRQAAAAEQRLDVGRDQHLGGLHGHLLFLPHLFD